MQAVKFTGPGDSSKMPQGAHIGTLIQIIDVGIQPAYIHKGEEVPPKPRLLLNFEFPNIKDQEGNAVSHIFDISFSDYAGSNLNLYANALLGGTEEVTEALKQELNFMDLLGKSAQIQIGKTDTEKARPKIITMMPLPAGLPHPKPSVIPTFFDMDNPDVALFKTFIPWVQKKILNAENVPQILKNAGRASSKTSHQTGSDPDYPWIGTAIEPNEEHF